MLLVALQPGARADSIPVLHVQGTVHGFLDLRDESGHVVASGDSIQTTHGSHVTVETIFHFKDGSVDDEITEFTQHRTFQLISDHHVQKGPSFPHPMDMTIDAHSGQVTIRTSQKDGKDDVKTDHVNLPADLANGMVPLAIENMRANATDLTVSMLIAIPKPRVVKLNITKIGEDEFAAGGETRKAIHHEIKIDLGGVVGMIAPIIGKTPPHIQIWTVGGEAPVFIREQGPLYPDGPMMTIELAGPVWPEQPKAGN